MMQEKISVSTLFDKEKARKKEAVMYEDLENVDYSMLETVPDDRKTVAFRDK